MAQTFLHGTCITIIRTLICLIVTTPAIWAQDITSNPANAPQQAGQERITPETFRQTMAQLRAAIAGGAALDEMEAFIRGNYAHVSGNFGEFGRETIELEALLAEVVLRQARIADAREIADIVLSGVVGHLAHDDPLVYDIAALRIRTVYINGDYEEALGFAAEVLMSAEKFLGNDHLSTLDIRMAAAEAAAGELETAESHFAAIEEVTGASNRLKDSSLRAVALVEWTKALERSGRLEDALSRIGTASLIFGRLYTEVADGDVNPDQVSAMQRRERILWLLGRGDEMRAQVDPMLLRVEAVYGRDNFRWAGLAYLLALHELGDGSDRLRSSDRAIAPLTEVEAIRAAALSPLNVELIEVRNALGYALAEQRRMAEALDVFGRTIKAGFQPRRDYYIATLAIATTENLLPRPQIVNEALRYLQANHEGSAAVAQTMFNARLRAGEGPAARLMRERWDAEAALTVARGRLADAVAQPAEVRNDAVELAARDDVRLKTEALEAVQQRIVTEMPDLGTITGVDVMDLEAVQAALGNDDRRNIRDLLDPGSDRQGLRPDHSGSCHRNHGWPD